MDILGWGSVLWVLEFGGGCCTLEVMGFLRKLVMGLGFFGHALHKTLEGRYNFTNITEKILVYLGKLLRTVAMIKYTTSFICSRLLPVFF